MSKKSKEAVGILVEGTSEKTIMELKKLIMDIINCKRGDNVVIEALHALTQIDVTRDVTINDSTITMGGELPFTTKEE